MSISAPFIRRPVMTTLVMLAILLLGIAGYRSLPVSELPNVDFPTIVVSANLPGANPETMASAVATPLEKQFSTIAGIDSMTSVNALGSTQITLQFDLERDIDAAAQDVQSMIARASNQLPNDMPSPPSFRKVNPADQPVLYLALSSPTLPLSTVNEYADTLIAQRVSMISGVAQVQIFGAQKYAVRVQLDPDALASRGVGIDEVSAAVRQSNVNIPTGSINGPYRAFTINTAGQLLDADAFKPIVVAYRNGRPVRLQELGRVNDDVENNRIASWYRDTRAIVLAVQRQPGTNTIEVVDRIKELLPEFRHQMPASVNLNILFDRTVSIRESVHDIKFTLGLTVALVVMVIGLFLRNLSSTIIPSLALPMSIIGTFAVMYMMGYSVNNLSLMALTLSVGFVVDDAIVMLENIVRHIEKGERAVEAAFKGAREIGFTIVSMTLSLVAVFIPVFFMGGILGRLLHEFAVTIGAAILISGFISLTLTPMLCSRFLKPTSEYRQGRVSRALENGFNKLRSLYEQSLSKVLAYRRATIAVSMAILVATVYLFWRMPTGFLPSEDISQIFCFTEGQQGVSFEEMKRHQQELAAILLKDPNVEAFMSSVGGGSSNSGNTGRIIIRLKPRSERSLSVDEVIKELRPKLSKTPGIKIFMQNPPPIRIGGQVTKSQYQYTVQGTNIDELYKYAAVLEERMKGVTEIDDVTSDLLVNNPQINVRIDRDRASALGVSAEQIENTLYTAYGSREISTIFAPNNQYTVIMELDPKYQADPAALSKLYVRSSQNKLVPLSAVASITRGVGPLTINHQGQNPSVTISFNLKDGVALSQAVDKVEKAAGVVPAGITSGFAGAAEAFQASTKGMWILILMAILVIYIVLGILYESFIHPITVLSGLPSAGFGAALTLMVFHKDLNIYSIVGVLMLVGIVKKNAIMMIDFAIDAQRNEGKTAAEAIYQGALIRFRPIMMTTMAALMGTLPIALGFGAGAESRRPLGLAVVGGLLFSQVLTLYITPVVYIYLDAFQERFRAWRGRGRTLPA